MIVAVINLKGGVGKTTTALALATAAVREGTPATVLDTDEQSSASLWAYAAEQAGSPLGFEVRSANLVDLKRLRPDDGLTVIDTPPTGNVTDAAKDAADFVIVPTSPNTIDLQQTADTVMSLEAAGKDYAVLVTKAERNTIAFKAAREFFSEKGTSIFDTVIYKRADIGNAYGRRLDDLNGYDLVWNELREAMK